MFPLIHFLLAVYLLWNPDGWSCNFLGISVVLFSMILFLNYLQISSFLLYFFFIMQEYLVVCASIKRHIVMFTAIDYLYQDLPIAHSFLCLFTCLLVMLMYFIKLKNILCIYQTVLYEDYTNVHSQ